MSSENNKTLIHQLYAEMDRRRTAPAELYTDTFTLKFNGNPPMNPEGVDQFVGMFYAAFPDLTHTVKDILAEGDRIAVHLVARGTHQGDLMGIPATGKSVEVSALAFFRIAHGKIAEQEGVFDEMRLLQQIGAVPAPA